MKMDRLGITVSLAPLRVCELVSSLKGLALCSKLTPDLHPGLMNAVASRLNRGVSLN